MKIAIYSTQKYDQVHLERANQDYGFELLFFEFELNKETVKNAYGCQAIIVFVNDDVSKPIIEQLAKLGVQQIALRCAGFDNVDIKEARNRNINVVRVPSYSPEAITEHAVGLMLTLNRKIHKAWLRTRDANFSLAGLTGFNMRGKTAGIIGTGKIGFETLLILQGFGLNLLVSDPIENPQVIKLGAKYVALDQLFQQSDIISLHCPMSAENHHLLNAEAFNKMKDGVMIINTSRGGLIDSKSILAASKSKRIGALGMDVYENERDLFFGDNSNEMVQDDIFLYLSACHNVIFTGHQAFLTTEALSAIAETTLNNLALLHKGKTCANVIN